MNNKERELRRRKIRNNLIEAGEDVFDRKGVRVHGDNFQHFIVKSAIYKVLQEAEHDNVYTEVTFPNGCIADVLDTHMAHVYEVETGKTESSTKAKWKDFDYPWINDVIVIDPDRIMSEAVQPIIRQEFSINKSLKTVIKPELVLDN